MKTFILGIVLLTLGGCASKPWKLAMAGLGGAGRGLQNVQRSNTYSHCSKDGAGDLNCY